MARRGEESASGIDRRHGGRAPRGKGRCGDGADGRSPPPGVD